MNINHRVAHIYQGDENYCWAAAIAMVKGGRTSDDASNAVAAAVRAGLRVNANTQLGDDDVRLVARANGLHRFPGPSPLTVESLRQHVLHHPCVLFVYLWRDGDGGPTCGPRTGHVLVLSGMVGDGSDSTTLLIHDPMNQGGVSRISFADFTGGQNATICRLTHIVRR